MSLFTLLFIATGYTIFSNITSKYYPDYYLKCLMCDKPIYIFDTIPIFNWLDKTPRDYCNQCITFGI